MTASFSAIDLLVPSCLSQPGVPAGTYHLKGPIILRFQ
jgi:hypothetical protein